MLNLSSSRRLMWGSSLSNPEAITRMRLDEWVNGRPILSQLITTLVARGTLTDENDQLILEAIMTSLKENDFYFEMDEDIEETDEYSCSSPTADDMKVSHSKHQNVIHFLIADLMNTDPNLLLRLLRILLRKSSFQPHLLSYTQLSSAAVTATSSTVAAVTISIYQHVISNWYRPYLHPDMADKPSEDGYQKIFVQLEVIGELMVADTTGIESHSTFFDYLLSTWITEGTISAESITRFLALLPLSFLVKINLDSPRSSMIKSERSMSWLEVVVQIRQQWRYNSAATLIHQVFSAVVKWQQQQRKGQDEYLPSPRHQQIQPPLSSLEHQLPPPHSIISSTTSVSPVIPSTFSLPLTAIMVASASGSISNTSVVDERSESAAAIDIVRFLADAVKYTQQPLFGLRHWVVKHSRRFEAIHACLTSSQSTTHHSLLQLLLESQPCADAFYPSTNLHRTVFGCVLAYYWHLIEGDDVLFLQLLEHTLQQESAIAPEQFLREMLYLEADWETDNNSTRLGNFPIAVYSRLLPYQSPLADPPPIASLTPDHSHPLLLFIDHMVRTDTNFQPPFVCAHSGLPAGDRPSQPCTSIPSEHHHHVCTSCEKPSYFYSECPACGRSISSRVRPIKSNQPWFKVQLLLQSLPEQAWFIRKYITQRCVVQMNLSGLKSWFASPFMRDGEQKDSSLPIFYATELVDVFFALLHGGILEQQETAVTFLAVIPLWNEIRSHYETNCATASSAVQAIIMSECQLPSDVISYVLLPFFQHSNLTNEYPFTQSAEEAPLTSLPCHQQLNNSYCVDAVS